MSRTYRCLDVSERFGVTIVKLNSRRVDPHNFEQVMEELFALIDEERPRKMLLNLSEVRYLYSTAIARLAELDRRIREAAGVLHLCGVQQVVREVFDVTHLVRRFEISETEEQALEQLW